MTPSSADAAAEVSLVSPAVHVASPYNTVNGQDLSGWSYGVYGSDQAQDHYVHGVSPEVLYAPSENQGDCNISHTQNRSGENWTQAAVPQQGINRDTSVSFFEGLDTDELKEVEL
jgi:hypothetical protein